MKTRWWPLTLVSLLFLAAWAFAEQELRVAVQTSGHEVAVRVQHADGRPAEGAAVRLLYGRQIVVAAGRTDLQGRWVQAVAEAGAYEVAVDCGPTEETAIREPFVVHDAPGSARFPWLAALLAALTVIGVALLAWARKKDYFSKLQPRWRAALAVLILLTATGGVWSWSQRPRKPMPAPGRNVASAAREFLNSQNVKPLSGSLEKLLADASTERVATQQHPVLEQPAPDFTLADTKLNDVRLRDLLVRGPVVLIFYYGYHCDHCVGQLFASNDDLPKFHELGAEIVALSADPPQATLDRFREYGAFSFPVLFDPGNKTAAAYGVYEPATANTPERLQHGTFIVGRDGRVHWAYVGKSPFTGNLTLLYELGKLEGRLPANRP
ncbi:MAG TPA: redoxin domain-containing protein [Gemmataceae bacterium]|nr:redoxin domain-containing protein [Gemmataceae bacterium]